MTRDVSDDMRAGWARTVLTVDGIGCFAAAGVVMASDKILGMVNPSLKSRLPLAGALLTTSVLLLRGAARKRPRPEDLRRAAAINLGWVLACTTSRRSTPTRAGRQLLAATALLDGACGWLQWKLGRDASREE